MANAGDCSIGLLPDVFRKQLWPKGTSPLDKGHFITGEKEMPKSDLQKAIEKQTKETQKAARESKKIARAAKNRELASTIISAQPIVAGLRIMDQEAEDTLKAILEGYDGNEANRIRFEGTTLPEYLQGNATVQFEKLQMYGMLTDYLSFSPDALVTISERAKTYFEDKERAQAYEREERKNMIRLAEIESRKKYDVFISHASKDKNDYVDLLVMAVKRLGIDVFYDTDAISWGDNWKQIILEGTSNSEFAVIVISENFFGREWTERELNEFLSRQDERNQKTVLPLLLNITREQLVENYPELTEIQYVDANNVTKDEVVILLAKELIKRYK